MEFEIWHIWLMASIIFFILEIFIPSFVVFNLGIGALFATIAAAFGLSVQWQFFIFSIFTLTSFFVVRPALKHWAYRKSDNVHTNMDALIGRVGTVTETIDLKKNSGHVKIDGDLWNAQSSDEAVIPEGTAVKVVKVKSIVLEVSPVT